jgi:hypothetical protein
MIETLSKTKTFEVKQPAEISAGDIYRISDSKEPPWKTADASGQEIPVLYRISDSKEPPWEKAGLGEQEIPVLYRISDSTEPPWNLPEKMHPLTDEDREKIKKETGWSDAIVDAIKTKEEYEIYKNAGLKEAEINGKPCLIRTDIDMDQKDEFGRTNKERMQQGLAPLDKKGKSIELHHIGQKPDSPLAELTEEEHRGKGNDTILHDKTKESEIDRDAFKKEKEDHWETRSKEER